MTTKNKTPKPICAGDVDIAGLNDKVSLKHIKDMLKEADLKTKDAYLKIEFNYDGCYYENDCPNISVKVYGWK